jgi:hypothetical protein
MAKSKKQAVTLQAIRLGLIACAHDFLNRLAERQPNERLYAFLFEISCEGFSAHGAAATEEGLTRCVQKLIEGGRGDDFGNDLEKGRARYRWWGPEDGGWYQQPDEAFQPVQELLQRAEDEGLYETYSDNLNRLCIEALQAMDAVGRFGSGPARGRVVLGVCYIGADNSPEEFLGWAKEVNPPAVYRRLRREYLNND